MMRARAVKPRDIILVLIVLVSFFGSSLWILYPVRARVFSMDLPNVDLGALELKIIGEYEIHLDDLNLSGHFTVENETVRYYLEILSADISYKAHLVPETSNLTVRYEIDYQGLNFTVAAASFSLNIDYVQVSSKGELVITLIGEDMMNLSVYEMVPQFGKARAQWPGMHMIKIVGAGSG